MARFELHHGDCLAVLKTMPDSSVDAVVCDPPYGLSKEPDMAEVLRHWLAGDDYVHRGGGGFMGKKWDSFVPGPAIWRECLRVLKPGGHLLAFFGTRTQDIGTLAIRLAGFEVRDSIAWVYASGFPKSLDVSKAIDKAAGVERSDLSEGKAVKRMIPGADQDKTGSWIKDNGREYVPTVTAPATDAARQWQGWGTALKPALEPITVARKPFRGTVAANVLAHGTGAINIDGCRIPSGPDHAEKCASVVGLSSNRNGAAYGEWNGARTDSHHDAGRWPANLIHDGSPEVLAQFPDSNGAGGSIPQTKVTGYGDGVVGTGRSDYLGGPRTKVDSGSGSAARFFKTCEISDETWLENLSPALTAARNLSLSRVAAAIAQSDAATSALREGTALSVLMAASTAVTASESKRIAEAVITAMPIIVSAFWLGPPREELSLSLDGVSVAARQTQIGTTTITVSLSKSDGYAGSITFSITQSSLEAGGKGCGLYTGSRFMYCAKANRRDRNEGLSMGGAPAVGAGATMREREDADWKARNGNHHPTVKPTDLMAYLCRLVTPPGGVVLDPFTGSGSTGKAAMLEGFRFIGIEREAEYLEIARARISAIAPEVLSADDLI